MKKNLTISKLLMLVIIAVLPLSMMAQEGKKIAKPAEKYWYIQADGGLSIYHGDLANYNGGIWDDFTHGYWNNGDALKNWNAHFGIGYQFGKVIGLNLKGGYGLYAGHKHNQALVLNSATDVTRYNLGLDRSNYIEGNLNLTFNLFNMFKYNPRRVINLVPHVGIGGVYYKAGAVSHLDGDDNPDATIADAADKRELNFTVPAGMEITFNVAPKFDIFLDYTYNFTGSDNMDQVAKIATDEAKHIINDKDMYSQVNLGLRYKFNDPCDIDHMKEIEIKANPDPLVVENDSVCFDVIVTVPAEFFEKKAVMNVKPYFEYNGGQIELPSDIILVGEKVKAKDGYDFRVPYKTGGEFTKHYCMPYQEEMAESELMGKPMTYVYNGTIYPNHDEIAKNAYNVEGNTKKLADVVAYEWIENTVYDTTYTNNYVTKCTYFFKKDRYVISERKNLNNAADKIVQDLLEAGVTDFRIEAWASPEGEEDHNNTLSNNRNKATEDQLNKLANGKSIKVNGVGKGEDVNKFRELVANSNLKDKNAIVSAYDNASNKYSEAERLCRTYERELEKGGDNAILPQIRRAEVQVNEPQMVVTPRIVREKVMKK